MTVARSGPSRRSHGQSGVPKRSARSGQRLGEEVRVQVDDGHGRLLARAGRRRRAAGRAGRPARVHPPAAGARAGRARRRRTRRTPGGRSSTMLTSWTSLRCTRAAQRGQYHSNAVGLAGRAGALDHQADRARHRPLRRVADVGRAGGTPRPRGSATSRGRAVLPDAQDHVARELVEELLARVVVEVGALVGSADDGDDEVAVVPDLGVADRRLELVAVLVDPARRG